MIQAYAGDLLLVGVTRGNIDRLTAGQPLQVKLLKSVTEVVVIFGEDKPAILRTLEEAGAEIAQTMKDDAASDPL